MPQVPLDQWLVYEARDVSLAGRRCDGYLPATSNLTRRDMEALAQQASLADRLMVVTQRPAQAPASLSSSPGGGGGGGSDIPSGPPPRECRLFDLFRSTTAPATATLAPSQFWTRDILQLAHVEPAVWHAVVALGGLHCRWHAGTVEVQSLGAIAADEVERHYDHAVSLAQRMQHPERALAVSLALGAAANLMGSLGESRVHVAAGRKLLCGLGSSDEVRSMEETVARMDFEAMSFGEVTAPYELQDPALLRYDASSNAVISSYEQAVSGLLRMMRMVMMSDEEASTGTDVLSVDGVFRRDLRAWEVAMNKFEAASGYATRVVEGSYDVPALSVRFYHSLVRVFIIAGTPGPETRFDAHLDIFSRILVLAEALERRLGTSMQSMTMEPGLVMALFFIGSKCRHPTIRWRCVSLLNKLNRQEGLWRSDAIGAALRRVCEVEEEEMLLDSACDTSSALLFQNGGDTQGDLDSDDRLRESMAVPWTAWADPGFLLPSWETWDGKAIVPEVCRVQAFLPTISVKDRFVAAKFFMSPGEAAYGESVPRVREERCWF